MKKTHHLLTLVLLVCAFFVLMIAYWISSEEITTMPIVIQVGDHVGFNVDQQTINFGTALPGSTVEREVVLTTDKDSLITLTIEGLDFVSPHESHFVLEKGKTKRASILATVPKNQPPGGYNGTLIIKERRQW